MSVNIKNTVIVSFLVLVTLPFILVTDLFPLMRFGMFAEPVKSEIQKEVFILTYTSEKGVEHVFDPRKVGIEPHIFFYLARNYYYRGESNLLIEKINSTNPSSTVKEWKLKRLLVKNNSEADTSVVFKKIQ